jgi:predicted NAD/FAD-binding protein
MSFSVSSPSSATEYCGTSLSTLFADRRNLLRPRFLRMLLDILRFNRRARDLLESGVTSGTMRQVVASGRYSRAFVEEYLVPMGAAIWSADPTRFLDMPAGFFLRFFDNHGLLRARRQLPWRTISGGARRYVEALVAPFRDRLRVASPVRSIQRQPSGVTVTSSAGGSEPFDQVVIATHSDQALALLADPSDAERDILGSIPYQANSAVLHTDDSVLPRRPAARASWNVLLPETRHERVLVTYDMRVLQGLRSSEPLCVSLNLDRQVADDRVLDRTVFEHPRFDAAATAAQARRDEICGVRRTHYCGAYWRNGFHEDGLQSALVVGRRFGREL